MKKNLTIVLLLVLNGLFLLLLISENRENPTELKAEYSGFNFGVFDEIKKATNEGNSEELYDLSSSWFREQVSYSDFEKVFKKEKLKIEEIQSFESTQYGGVMIMPIRISVTHEDGVNYDFTTVMFLEKDKEIKDWRYNNLPISTGFTLRTSGAFERIFWFGFSNIKMIKNTSNKTAERNA